MNNKKVIYSKKLDFGKIDYNGTGRKVNLVEVEIELKGKNEFDKDMTLSICGNIWNSKHTDIICGGQCYDELLDAVKTPLMYEIVGVWKRWHLNDMNAGDKTQEDYLRENGHGVDYQDTCDRLEKAGLLTHKGYRYGTAWKLEQIPHKVISQIMGWSV